MFGRGRQFQSYAFSNLPGKALDGTKLQRRLRALLVVFLCVEGRPSIPVRAVFLRAFGDLFETEGVLFRTSELLVS
jgi:hypothetical protein